MYGFAVPEAVVISVEGILRVYGMVERFVESVVECSPRRRSASICLSYQSEDCRQKVQKRARDLLCCGSARTGG